MLNISESEQAKYFLDNTHKEMYITVDDEPGTITDINWYLKDDVVQVSGTCWTNNFMTCWHDEVNQTYFRYAEDLYVSCRVKWISGPITGFKIVLWCNGSTLDWPDYMDLNIDWIHDALTDPNGEGLRLFGKVPKNKISDWCKSGDPDYGGTYPKVCMWLYGHPGGTPTVLQVDQIQINTKYRVYHFDELYPSEYRYDYDKPDRYGINYSSVSASFNNKSFSALVVPAGDYIEPFMNSDIKYNQFQLTESICSRDSLHVGAVESNTFQTVIFSDKKLNGRYIRPYIYTADEERTDNHSDPFFYSEINWFKGTEVSEPGVEFTNTFSNVDISKDLDSVKVFGEINKKYFKQMPYLGIRFKVKMSDFSSDVTPVYVRFAMSVTFVDGGIGTFTSYLTLSEASNWIDFYRFYAKDYKNGFLRLNWITVHFYDANKQSLTAGTTGSVTVHVKEIQVQLSNVNNVSYFRPYDPEECYEYQGVNIDDYILKRQLNLPEDAEPIPLGRFLVSDSDMSEYIKHKEQKLICYDKLGLLDVDASNWYSMYMYGFSMDGYTDGGFEYTRQMYSTFWNLITATLIDNRSNHTENVIYEEVSPSYYTEGGQTVKHFHWEIGEALEWFFENIWYGRVHVDFTDENKSLLAHPFVLDVSYIYTLCSKFGPIQNHMYVFSSYRNWVDYYGRGIINKACICVEETLSDGTTNKFLVDNGDYFMLSPNCSSVNIWYAHTQYPHTSGAGIYGMVRQGDASRPGVRLSSVSDITPEFVNASERLVYYNYETKEIFTPDSQMTALNVMGSLTEINGCFINSNRYGKLEFLYCEQATLFPREDLYPNDEEGEEHGPIIYPGGDSILVPVESCNSSNYANYRTKEFGRIQVKNRNDSYSNDVVTYEYVSETDNPNTYILDDNVFYSGGEISYKKDKMPELNKVFSKMYEHILNLSYTPNITGCVGMPWVEAGDRISIMTNTGGFNSIIFRRTMNGTQVLKDVLEAYGEESTAAIDTYSFQQYKDTPIRPFQ